MTKQEFEHNNRRFLEKQSKNELECLATKKPEVTEEEYRQIEHVYNFHPSISETYGKIQISQLYMAYGMAIIRDMTPRANRMMELERRQQCLRCQMEEVKGEIRAAREGWDM